MQLPNCLDCKYAEQGYPCQKPDGSYDYEKVARALIVYGRTFSVGGDNLDPEVREANAWAGDCAYEVEEDHADMLIPLTVAAADACETPMDAAYVAAGLLENAITKHGARLIDEIENLAKASPKFRYFLSGVWGGSRTDPEVWKRVCKATGHVGLMDNDGRGPSDGAPVTVLGDAEVAALLKTSIKKRKS